MSTEKDTGKELEEISPLLAQLSKKMPYTTPDNYFDDLPSKLLRKAKGTQGKVVDFSFKKRVLRLAIAAIIVGIIVTGGWLFFSQPVTQSNNRMLADNDSIAEKEMQLQAQQISEAEMADYITGNTTAFNEVASLFMETKDDDFGAMLQDISDQELQRYLDQNNITGKIN